MSYQNKFNMTREDNILFAKRNIIDSIYKEAKLEGIAITYPQTYELYEGRSVAGLSVEDVIKVNNLKHAWQFLLDTLDYPIDSRYIRQLNQEVGERIVLDAGSIRTSPVGIGGTSWIPDIPDYDDAVQKINDITNSNCCETEKAIDMMLYIMRSQLFNDGNKRTAQLAANQMLIANGCGIISVPVERLETFTTLLISFYETNDSSQIKEFLYEECIFGLNKEQKIEQPRIDRNEFYNHSTENVEEDWDEDWGDR